GAGQDPEAALEDLFAEGIATKLDVLQSRNQRFRDRQALVSQQIKRTQSAPALATALYLNPAIDLNVQDRTVRKIRLIAQTTKIGALIGTAIQERPELPKMEERRLATLQLRNRSKSAFLPS
ncbi:MAG TPA: hypothetical protein PKC98_17200, partial [Candidatus Melainabacteria bacterium]|nr:hypothetical protein [Candidatus Melainabacteria bacterium]